MAYTMDPLADHESYLGLDAPALRDDYFGWLDLEAVIDEWPGWHDPVAAASNTARPASQPPPPSQPAPVLLQVAPTPLAAPAGANPSCHAANKGEKQLRPRELTMVLRCWLERREAPYASLEEKKMMAEALSIPVAQVTNFCNNFRKRYVKVGAKLTSYRELASAAQ